MSLPPLGKETRQNLTRFLTRHSAPSGRSFAHHWACLSSEPPEPGRASSPRGPTSRQHLGGHGPTPGGLLSPSARGPMPPSQRGRGSCWTDCPAGLPACREGHLCCGGVGWHSAHTQIPPAPTHAHTEHLACQHQGPQGTLGHPHQPPKGDTGR